MASKYAHMNESWPYHQDPHGNMVPRASNPCKLHSGKGTDLMITGGPDEAKMVYSQFENNINMITLCLHTYDDIINALLQEMRDDYNNRNDLTAFYNKYNFTAYNGSITDVDVSNNAFK